MPTHLPPKEKLQRTIESLKNEADLAVVEEQLLDLLYVVQKRAEKLLTKPIRSRADFSKRIFQLKKAYKQGRFTTTLAKATRNLSKYLRHLDVTEEAEYYKARTLLYELNDILSIDPEINEWTFVDGERAFTQLQQLARRSSKLDQVDRKLIKEKILFCSCYGHGLKRRNDPKRAEEVFQWLLRFTTDVVKTDELPSYGTRANLSYHLGSVYRVLEQHEQSHKMYTQALRFYHDRSRTRPVDDLDDLDFTTRRIAMCVGLGFGWLHLTRGNLHRAENSLITARVFLAKSPDPIVAFFIELLYGTIRRCRAGHDQDEAIASLDKARKSFERTHPRYHAYACLELALSFTQKGDYDKALEYLEIAEKYAVQQQGEFKWLVNIHIRRSRIRRHQDDYERALSEAETAIEMAESSASVLPRADAYIARGESRLYFAEEYASPPVPAYISARKDFERALKLVVKKENTQNGHERILNPKIASVCELRIAQCYAREGNQIEATNRFEHWRRWQATVEHQWVRDLAKEVERDIRRLDDFFSISSKNSAEWNYHQQLNKLRDWLYAQALHEADNDKEVAASLLGVSRSTIFNWREGATRGRAKRTK